MASSSTLRLPRNCSLLTRRLGVGADVGSAGPVRIVRATYDGVWELPVIGEVDAPPAEVPPAQGAEENSKRSETEE